MSYYAINADGEGYMYDGEAADAPAGVQLFEINEEWGLVPYTPPAAPAPAPAPAGIAALPAPAPAAAPVDQTAPRDRYLALDGDGGSFEFDPTSGDFPVGMEIYRLPEGGGMIPVDPSNFPEYQRTINRLQDPSLLWGEPGSLGYSLSRYAGVPDYYMAKNMQMIQDAAPNVAPNFDWTQAVQNMSAKQAAQFGGLNDAEFNDGQLPAKLFEMIPGGATAMQNLQQLPSFQNAQAWGAERWAASQEDDGLLSGLLEPIQDVARFTKEGLLKEGYLLPIAAFAAPAILGGLGSLGAGATGAAEAAATGAAEAAATGAGGLSALGESAGSLGLTAADLADMGAFSGAAAPAQSGITGALQSLVDLGIPAPIVAQLPSTAIGAVRGAGISALTGRDPLEGALTGGFISGINPVISGALVQEGLSPAVANTATQAINQLIRTGDINPESLALGYVDPQIADALKGIVPSQAMPAVISLANQALTGQDLNLAAAGASALGASVSPGIDRAVRDAIRPTYQYTAEETPSVFDETDAGMAEAFVNPYLPETLTIEPTPPNFTATVVPDEPVMPAAVEPTGGIQQGLPAVETTPQTPVDTYQNSFDTGEMQRILGIPAAIEPRITPEALATWEPELFAAPEPVIPAAVEPTGGLTQEAIDSWEPQLPEGTKVSIDDSGSYVVTDQDGNLISTTESQPDRYTTVQQDNGTQTVVDTYTGEVVDRIGYTDGTDPSARTWAQANEDQDRAMLGDDPVQVYRDLGLIDPDATDLSALDRPLAYTPDGGVIDANQLPAYTASTTTTRPRTGTTSPTIPSASGPLQKISEQFNVKQDNKYDDPSKRGYLNPQFISTGQQSQVAPLWQGFVDQLQKRGYAIGGMVDHPIEHVPGPEDRMYMKHHTQGFAVGGPGTGQSDDIPTMLSDGEYVIDADTVAALGDGSSKAGSEVLDKFRQEIRKHKRSASVDKIPPKAKNPLSYLKAAQKGSNHG